MDAWRRYFNPRTPVGCDAPLPTPRASHENFNPRTPVGCDVLQTAITGLPIVISIHAPQWGATTRRPTWTDQRRHFNPRTPVGCDMARLMVACSMIFQSTHPSGVRQASRTVSGSSVQFQSTHPSGVRLVLSKTPKVRKRFQSTHPSGVRLTKLGTSLRTCIFQSTHPSGVRLATPIRSASSACISIHAPQWGATGIPPRLYASTKFQSTHPSGVRPRTGDIKVNHGLFQSTHPSGVRPECHLSWCRRAHFNPRTPVGCDQSAILMQTIVDISIHAPQWGATSWHGRVVGV